MSGALKGLKTHQPVLPPLGANVLWAEAGGYQIDIQSAGAGAAWRTCEAVNNYLWK